jgi:acyl-CoA synthetase (NDP forming)
LSNLSDKFTFLFNARSIALVGASNDRGKWGFIMLKHLVDGGFEGRIYPVNPVEKEILGLSVCRSVIALPETPDLAVIVVPPPAVLPVINECVRKGIKAGIIITAGFAELGEEGARLQRDIADAARNGGMIFVGPNCNGVMSPWNRQYLMFPSFHVSPGPVAVVAQSGNVMDSLARQLMLHGLGCSLCIASGNEASLMCEDYLEYLGNDPHTQVILCYIEGFKNGRRFREIASEVSKKKPIIMLKAGKTKAGARAASSHTAAVAGSDNIFDAVCKQSGVIRARSLDELVQMGQAFLRQPLPSGPRIGILTGGGGWGVLAADACSELGFDVVKLPEATIRKLDKLLPAWWNRGNPVDLVAGATADNIFKAINLVMQCANVDCMMFLSIMPALRVRGFDLPTDPSERVKASGAMVKAVIKCMEDLNAMADRYKKPLVVATEHIWANLSEEANIGCTLGQHNCFCYHMPDHAAAVLKGLLEYGEYVRQHR